MGKTKEEQQRRVLEYQHFDLVKFKIADEKATVKFFEFGNEHTMSPKEFVHPDLNDRMKELKLYMATTIGLLVGWDFAREHCKKDPDALQMAIQGHKDAVENCKPNGFTFVGDGETRGVQITGSIKSPYSGQSGLGFPKVTFGKDKFGIEDELEELCEQIKSELYQYLFQHKKAQLDVETEAEKAKQSGMFDDEDEETEDGEPVKMK